jgi:hypothetical protein
LGSLLFLLYYYTDKIFNTEQICVAQRTNDRGLQDGNGKRGEGRCLELRRICNGQPVQLLSKASVFTATGQTNE